MNTLYNEIYSVLDRYSIEWSSNGVSENFRKWERHKKNLVDLLSKHPQWDWSAMAIVFDVTESREINPSHVSNYKYDLLDLAKDTELSSEQRNNFSDAIHKACGVLTRTIPNDYIASVIKSIAEIKCVTGQKTSKVINAICVKFGIDKHPEYNKRFAKLSDSLNPIQIRKKALLSVHPCDYLEMSSDRNSWQSCHRINGGEYQAGTLSYMNDKTSMIFFTVDENVTEKFFDVPKRTRQVFAYENDILLQSCLYGSDDSEIRTNYRNIVQSAIAKCLDRPNMWTLKREEIGSYIVTDGDALHYRDYDYNEKNPSISLLKNLNDEYKNITIGYAAYCLMCDEQITENEALHCNYCHEEYVSCWSCDNRVIEDDTVDIGGYSYCRDCVEYCDHCGEYFTGDSFLVYNSRGREIDVCESCAMNDFYCCDDCGIYSHHNNIHDVDNGTYCNDCFEENYTSCTNCEEEVNKEDVFIANYKPYCDNCFHNNFAACNECGDAIEIDERHCQYCVDKLKKLYEEAA